MSSHKASPEMNTVHPYYSSVNALPGVDPINYLSQNKVVSLPEQGGHLLNLTVHKYGAFMLDLYPFRKPSDMCFTRGPGASYKARLDRTVEAGICVGRRFSHLAADPERWTTKPLSTGHEIHGCQPPLTEIAANVSLNPASGNDIVHATRIIGGNPATFEPDLMRVAARLGIENEADQICLLEIAQDQVRGFWNRPLAIPLFNAQGQQ